MKAEEEKPDTNKPVNRMNITQLPQTRMQLITQIQRP